MNSGWERLNTGWELKKTAKTGWELKKTAGKITCELMKAGSEYDSRTIHYVIRMVERFDITYFEIFPTGPQTLKTAVFDNLSAR